MVNFRDGINEVAQKNNAKFVKSASLKLNWNDHNSSGFISNGEIKLNSGQLAPKALGFLPVAPTY